MSGNFHRLREVFIQTRPLRRMFVLLMLAISLPGTGQITAARAAPPAQETITNMRFYLNISYPTTLCAGREYSIPVTPLVELDGKRGTVRNSTTKIGSSRGWRSPPRSETRTSQRSILPSRRVKNPGTSLEYLLVTSSFS